jgi:hypothetical protein
MMTIAYVGRGRASRGLVYRVPVSGMDKKLQLFSRLRVNILLQICLSMSLGLNGEAVRTKLSLTVDGFGLYFISNVGYC